MRVLRTLTVVLMSLVVLAPAVIAATFECWIDGLYDAASDDGALATQYEVVAIEGAPGPVIAHLRGIAVSVAPVEEPGIRAAVLGALLTRAPPLS